MNNLNRAEKLDKFVSLTVGNRSALWTVKLAFHANKFININIFGQNYLALIDTSAHISCITVRLYNNIQALHNLPIGGSDYTNLMLATGGVVQIKGQIMIQAILGNKNEMRCNLKFNVVQNLQHDIVLGQDFLRDYNVVMNYGDHSLILQGRSSVKALTDFLINSKIEFNLV
eukprot:GHVU01009141.1.p1 GENE.GHVU01009141.1~~GHVU01009141.1.p1  ORF type:complete len:172 (-),score=0.90 GHVU01009141.1:480-995(-)